MSEPIKVNKDHVTLAYSVGEGKNKDIVEYQGNFYYIGEDEDWAYADEHPLEYDEGSLEVNLVLASRRSIGTSTLTYSQEPYIPEQDVTDTFYYANKSNMRNYKARWLPSQGLSDKSKLYLPENELGIYKIVTSLDGVTDIDSLVDTEKPSCILFDEVTERNYCVRQVCRDCKYKDTCVKTLEKKKRDFRISHTLKPVV